MPQIKLSRLKRRFESARGHPTGDVQTCNRALERGKVGGITGQVAVECGLLDAWVQHCGEAVGVWTTTPQPKPKPKPGTIQHSNRWKTS